MDKGPAKIIRMVDLNKRFSEFEVSMEKKLEEKMDEKLEPLLEWKKSIDKSIQVQQRMIEVGEGIIDALGWIGKICKWIASVTIGGGIVYKVVGWLGHH